MYRFALSHSGAVVSVCGSSGLIHMLEVHHDVQWWAK